MNCNTTRRMRFTPMDSSTSGFLNFCIRLDLFLRGHDIFISLILIYLLCLSSNSLFSLIYLSSKLALNMAVFIFDS